MIVAELNQQLWWYVSRSAGFVSWGAVTLSVLWGLALSTKLMGKTATPAWLLDVHRFLGAFSIIFIGVHLVGLVGDNYVYFSWAELFVPMASTWQPGAVAWGIVAFYFLIAVQITSLVMKRIPRKLWRWVHFTSFAVYVTATVHAIESGTDVTNPIYRWTALVSVQLVFFMLGVRLVTTRRLKRSLREAVPVTSASGAPTADQTREERLAALRARRETPAEPATVDATREARLAALRERREKAATRSG